MGGAALWGPQKEINHDCSGPAGGEGMGGAALWGPQKECGSSLSSGVVAGMGTGDGREC